MKKSRVSLVLNILIVIFEIIGFVVTFNIHHHISYEYYTEDSNILAFFSSLFVVLFLILKKDIPRWVQYFKYITTICLTITFLVVIFILAPMFHFDYQYLMLEDSLLYQHTICPLLSIITFLFFDDLGTFKKRDSIIGLNLTFLYAIVLIILNIIGVVDGPYPFLRVREQSVLMSIIWILVIHGLAYVVANCLRKLYMKNH